MSVHDELCGRGAGGVLLAAALNLADNRLGLRRVGGVYRQCAGYHYSGGIVEGDAATRESSTPAMGRLLTPPLW